MKIDTNQISPEGLTITEDLIPSKLDLDADVIKFKGTLKATADISKITNAVTVRLNLRGAMNTSCSRCLEELEITLDKNVILNFPADKTNPVIDLDPDIREEVLLEYPIKPLCKVNCRGLCPACGENLNQGKCRCK